MSRLIFLLYLIALPMVDLCVRTIPPEDVGFTTTQVWDDVTTEAEEETTSEEVTTEESTTTVEENLCGECDINEIAPSPEANVDVTVEQDPPVDGCLVTYVACHRIGQVDCSVSSIRATNADGTVDISDFPTGQSTSTTLTCAKDGTYGHKKASGITQLSCYFEC
ncbi:unnamed protein product [Caenorhabditis nigoni]